MKSINRRNPLGVNQNINYKKIIWEKNKIFEYKL